MSRMENRKKNKHNRKRADKKSQSNSIDVKNTPVIPPRLAKELEELGQYEGPLPETTEISNVLNDEYYKKDYHGAIRSTLYTLITVSAIALLIATLLLPVIRIYGPSMEPTISDDSIILCRKSGLPERGDILSFYYNNKILVRRVIGLPGDEISVDANGTVTVNGELLREEYVHNKGTLKSGIIYPYTVPEGRYFVMADNRVDTLDSRSDLFGCIQEEDFIGQVIFCVWPMDELGLVH